MFADLSGFSTLADRLVHDNMKKEAVERKLRHFESASDLGQLLKNKNDATSLPNTVSSGSLYRQPKSRKKSIFEAFYRKSSSVRTKSARSEGEQSDFPTGSSSRMSGKRLSNALAGSFKVKSGKINMKIIENARRPTNTLSGSMNATESRGVRHARQIRTHDAAAELSETLDTILTLMIKCIVSHGGDVVTFCGDALLAIFPFKGNYELDRAQWDMVILSSMLCGVSMLEVPRNARLERKLGMHVGMGCSRRIRAVNVGGQVGNRWQTFIVGSILNQMYDAEALAKRGELVISNVLHKACADTLKRQNEVFSDMSPRSSNGFYTVSSFSCGGITQALVDGFLAASASPARP